MFISSATFKLLGDTLDAPQRCRPSTGPSTFVAAIFSILASAASSAVCSAQAFFKPNRPFVPVHIANVACQALYDSGADVSCIHDSVFRSFSPDLRPKAIPSPHLQFHSASGDALQVRGVYSISISLLDKTVQHNFYVIKNLSEQVILGADFIHQQGLAYCPLTTTTHWATPSTWEAGVARVSALHAGDPFSSTLIPISLFTASLARPASQTPLLMNVVAADFPAVSGGPALVFGKSVVETSNLSVQLQTLVFDNTHASTIGFLLTKDGIKLGTEKLKAVQLAAPPSSITKVRQILGLGTVRQILGLCKSFRTHVRDFDEISAPPTALTREDSGFTATVPLPLISNIFTETRVCVLAGHDALLATEKRCHAVVSASAVFQRLQFAKRTAVNNGLQSAKPYAFAINRMVMCQECEFFSQNRELSPEFSGTHFFSCLTTTHNDALVIVNVTRLTPCHSFPSLVYQIVGMDIPPGVSPLPSSILFHSKAVVAGRPIQEIVSAAKCSLFFPTLFHSDGAPELSLPLTLGPPAPLLGALRRRGRHPSSCVPPLPLFLKRMEGFVMEAKHRRKKENKLKVNTHISPGEKVNSLGREEIGFRNAIYPVSKGDIYRNQKVLLATERNKIKMTIVLFILSSLFLSVDASAEHVVFERIGQMSGATSFIHVHVTLGIGLITEQLDTYRDLLNGSFGNKEEIMDMFRKNIPSNIKTDPKMQESYFNSMAVLWMKITAQHRLDMLDAYVTLASLKNTLPDLPDNEVKKISARSHVRSERFDDKDRERLHVIAIEQGLDLGATINTHRTSSSPRMPAEQPGSFDFQLHDFLGILSTPHELKHPPRPIVVTPRLTVNAITVKPPYSIPSKLPKSPNNVVNGAPLLPLPHLRRRRDRYRRNIRIRRLAGIIALPMAVAATAMGIYNTEQINFLKTELGKLQDNQDRLFDVVYRHESVIKELTDALLETATAMVTIMIFNPALFDARLSRIENQIRNRLTKTTHALQAGLSRKLAVDYLTPSEVRSVFGELLITAEKVKCDLLIDHHSSLFQLETSLLFDGQDAHLLIHVPMVPHKALLRLYKLHPIPLPLSETHFLIPDVKNDVLAISTNDNRYAIQLSSMDLMGCYRSNQLFMCDRFGVLARGYNDTCLGSLYNQQFEAAQRLCKFEIVPITERVYQLKKHHFLVYLPQALTVPIKCRNGSTTEKHLSKGHREIYISSGCEAEFINHRITTDTSITFPADILHFEWQWDKLQITDFMNFDEIPVELLRLAHNGITRPTLSDLQFLAITKQKIGEMVRPEDWGLSLIHTISTGVLCIGVLSICAYASYRAYRCYNSSNEKRTAPPTPSAPGITIITGSSAPPPVSDQEARHPLASTRYFRSSPRKQTKPKNHQFSEPPVNFHVADDEVQLPYEPHHVSVNRESLLLRRDDLIESLSIIDTELHLRPSTSRSSESKNSE